MPYRNFGVYHEAYVPAQQPRPRSPPWLSRPQGDGRWPQYPARPPRPWPQEAVGLSKASSPQVLTRRSDFVAANRGLRVARPGFVLLTRANQGLGQRYGITVTKRIGNAVVRNRMKRRFRELLRDLLPLHGLADTDHVLIGREGGVERDFVRLRDELAAALTRARDGKGDAPRRPRAGR
jgi:ribonuclease P protein component